MSTATVRLYIFNYVSSVVGVVFGTKTKRSIRVPSGGLVLFFSTILVFDISLSPRPFIGWRRPYGFLRPIKQNENNIAKHVKIGFTVNDNGEIFIFERRRLQRRRSIFVFSRFHAAIFLREHHYNGLYGSNCDTVYLWNKTNTVSRR